MTHNHPNWSHEVAYGPCVKHAWEFRNYCGVKVCVDCGEHKGLARCYCGWSLDGSDGRAELIEMGEVIGAEDY